MERAQVEVLNSSGGWNIPLVLDLLRAMYTETIMVCTGETFTISVSVAGSYPSEIIECTIKRFCGRFIHRNFSDYSWYSDGTIQHRAQHVHHQRT